MSNKIPDTAPRTIRLHVPTYQAILNFFAASPARITGADAIREVLFQFGSYCQERQAKEEVASMKHLEEIEGIVLGIMEPADD